MMMMMMMMMNRVVFAFFLGALLISAGTVAVEEDKNVVFIFAIGLEGTGHHLGITLAAHSPAILDMPVSLKDPIRKVDRDMSHIWTAIDPGRKGSKYNAAAKFDKLVAGLRDVQQRATGLGPRHVFLSLDENQQGWSYPNGGPFEDRYIMYPDLDLLYMACDRAQVRCGHVYLYRDPRDVLNSVFYRRHFDKTVLLSIKLHTTMLHVQYAQLQAHAHRTLGCWGFFDLNEDNNNNNGTGTDDAEEDHRQHVMRDAMRDSIRDLFLWTAQNQTGFDQVMEQLFRPSAPLAVPSLTPSEELYMQSWQLAHDRNLELCRSKVHNRNGLVR